MTEGKIEDGFGEACPHGIIDPATCAYCSPRDADLSWMAFYETASGGAAVAAEEPLYSVTSED